MSVLYSVKSNTPTVKTVYALAPATTFVVWTPASGKMVNITDIIVSNAAAGTIRFYQTPSDATAATQTLLMEMVLAGSAIVHFPLETPIMVDNPDYIIRCVTGMNGYLGVTLLGFEST